MTRLRARRVRSVKWLTDEPMFVTTATLHPRRYAV